MPLTPEEKEELLREVREATNVGITARLKRWEEAQGAATEKFRADVLSAVKESQVEAAAQADAPRPGTVAAADARISALEKQLAEERAAGQRKERAARMLEARTASDKVLAGAGIKPEFREALLSHFERSGVLKFDTDGNPEMRVRRERIRGAGEDDQSFSDLAAGTADWLRSEAAKSWVPAPGAKPALRSVPSPPGFARATPALLGESFALSSSADPFERAAQRLFITADDIRSDASE